MILRITLLAALIFRGHEARAQEPAKKSWKDTAELNLTNTTGNTKVMTLGINDLYGYDRARWGLELKAGLLTSRSQGAATAEQYNAGEKAIDKVTGSFYGYEKVGWDKNRFAGILSRYDASLGVGDVLLEKGSDKVSAEAGAGFIAERRPDKQNNFASGRLYGKYLRTLSKTANLSQDAEYLNDFKDAKDYRFNAETALIAAVSTRFSLKASYKWKRVGKPAPGFGKDDTILGAALILNY